MNKPLFYIYASTANAWPITDCISSLKKVLKSEFGKSFRRTNHFIDLGLIGALRCAANSQFSIPPQCGVFVATGQGNVADGAAIDKTLYVDLEPPMPFQFINVSNNLAAYYVAQGLNLNSCNITVSRRDTPFEAALELASLDLQFKYLEYCLVGAIDECCLPLDQQCQRMSMPVGTALSEGSSWLFIGSQKNNAVAQCQLLEQYSDYQDMISALKTFKIDPNCQIAGGNDLSEKTLSAIGKTLGLSKQYHYLDKSLYHNTNAAYGIAAFFKNNNKQKLLHINKDYLQRYYVSYFSNQLY